MTIFADDLFLYRALARRSFVHCALVRKLKTFFASSRVHLFGVSDLLVIFILLSVSYGSFSDACEKVLSAKNLISPSICSARCCRAYAELPMLA